MEYEVVVSNNGFGTSHDTTVVIVLPDVAQVESDELGSFDTDTRTYTWNIGDLKEGTDKTAHFKIVIPSTEDKSDYDTSAKTSYIHVNSRSAVIADASPLSVHKDGRAQLVITSSHRIGEDDFAAADIIETFAGDIIETELVVDNIGKGTSRSTVITVPVPDGLHVVEPLNESLSYDKSANTLTWDIGNIKDGDKKSIQYTAVIPVTNGETFYKTSPVGSYIHTNSRTVADNITSNTLSVRKDGQAAIEVLLTQALNDAAQRAENIDETYAGDVVYYEIHVENNGTGMSHDTSISIDLPDGLIPEELDKMLEYDTDMNSIIWNLGDFPKNSKASARFKIAVPTTEMETFYPMAAHGQYIHTNSHEANEIESNTVTFRKDGIPELCLSKYQRINDKAWTDIERIEVSASDTLGYKVRIENAGQGVAKNVIFEDEIPAGLSIDEKSIAIRQLGDEPDDNAIVEAAIVKVINSDGEIKTISETGKTDVPANDDENTASDKKETLDVKTISFADEEPDDEDVVKEPEKEKEDEDGKEEDTKLPQNDKLIVELGDMTVGDVIEVAFETSVPVSEMKTIYTNQAFASFEQTNIRESVECKSNETIADKDGQPALSMSSAHKLSYESEDSFTSNDIVVQAGDKVDVSTTVSNTEFGDARNIEIKIPIPVGLKVIPESIQINMSEPSIQGTAAEEGETDKQTAEKEIADAETIYEHVEYAEPVISYENGEIAFTAPLMYAGQTAEITYQLSAPAIQEASSWTYKAVASYGHTNAPGETVSTDANALTLIMDAPLVQTGENAPYMLILGVILLISAAGYGLYRKRIS